MKRDRIGRYELLDVLGTGSFATVWRAHDPVVGMDVAVKLLADNLSQNRHIRERFMAEARVSLASNSNRMVRVHVVDETEDGQPYLVMALADRGSLEQRLAARGKLRVLESVAMARQIAIAVADMHRHGHIHRDLKPGNVLFRTGPDGEEVVLGDLGLAREFDRSAVTLVAGTPGYVSPEQAAGMDQLTPKTDLFPIGLVLLEMLTGEPPRKSRSMLAAATQDTIDVVSILNQYEVGRPPRLDALVQQLVERDPEGRPSSATEVADQLVGIMAEITDGEPLGAMTVDPGDPNTGRSLERESAKTNTTEPARRGGRRLWLAIAGAVIAVAAAVLILTRMGGSEPEPNAATTPEPAVSATSAAVEPVVADVADESTVTEAAAIPTPSEGDLDSVADVPLPEVAVIDRVATEPDRRIVANVAGSVADIEAFYENVEGWQILNRAANGEARMLLVTGDGPQFTVDLTPTALSSGSTTTSIVIEGST